MHNSTNPDFSQSPQTLTFYALPEVFPVGNHFCPGVRTGIDPNNLTVIMLDMPLATFDAAAEVSEWLAKHEIAKWQRAVDTMLGGDR